MTLSPSISADGRFVAFDANDELTPDDTNRAADVFVRDRRLGTTTLVSVRTDGSVGTKGGVDPEITPDGHFVLFLSHSKLVAAETNRSGDAYLRDLQTGKTMLASRTHKGRVASILSRWPWRPSVRVRWRSRSQTATVPPARLILPPGTVGRFQHRRR